MRASPKLKGWTAWGSSRLGQRLAFLIVSASAGIMLVISVFQLSLEYRDLRQGLDRNMDGISIHVDSISRSVWSFDEKQIALALQGLTRLPHMAQARIRTLDAESRTWQAGALPKDRALERTYPLHALVRSKQVVIGELTVVASLGSLDSQIIERAATIFATNLLKSVLVVLFMLYLFRRLVTARLEQLGSRIASLKQRLFAIQQGHTQPLTVDHAKDDELDSLERTLEQSTIELQNIVAERSAAKTQALEAAAHTRAILDNVIDAIITIDKRGAISSFSASASRMFGYTSDEVIGQNVRLLMPAPIASQHDGYLAAYASTGVPNTIGKGRETVARHKLGHEFHIHLGVSEFVHAGKPMLVGLIRDISASRKAEAEIHRLAYYDQLTGLPNRRLLLDRVAQALHSSTRSHSLCAMMFIDIDHFKKLNDTWGHNAGDQLLIQLAHRISQTLREGDTVSRLGGDEFMLLLSNMGDTPEEAANHAEQLARKVLALVSLPFDILGRSFSTSASLGITLFGQAGTTVEALIGEADVAMYEAKSRGRNAFHFFDVQLQQAISAQATLEADMRQGLARNEFALYLQPQVDTHQQTLGFEALLRWSHPSHGMVSPARFIPLAEQSGFILELGQWVLQQACRILAQWHQSESTRHLSLAVNVSAKQFRSAGFVDDCLSTLAATGAPASCLELELTESMLVDDVDSVIAKMTLLKQKGVRFSLDDFGTGYSSLSYLQKLPLDQLKIDQSFVRGLLTDSNNTAIVRAIVMLAHSLGMRVIAEGVETSEQRALLHHNGCTHFQGYLFARPLGPAELRAYLVQIAPVSAVL
jgi:diguanylate cyclase (GGDEF)-like protein/PAS domain S-box-containing protein